MTSTVNTSATETKADIRVSIVEDDVGIREGLIRLLKHTSGFRCLGAYVSAEEALKLIPKTKPDVVLMDINLPEMNGVDCARAIKLAQPSVQILMLTVFDDPQRIFEALAAGATGYLLKHSLPMEILDAIQDVNQGGAPMNSQIARKVVESFGRKAFTKTSDELSQREEQILRLLAQGYLVKEIAEQIEIGFGTVRTHIRHIYEKLHVHSRSQATAIHFGANEVVNTVGGKQMINSNTKHRS